MKSIVIYFSQTGSTRDIARAIHAGLSESSECDIARLQDIDENDMSAYDLIGLGGPVWHRREPANVMNFIEYTMNSLEGRHAFTFCTHGLLPGRFIARVVAMMKQKGLTVIGWNNWYGSVTMPEKPKPYFTDGHPDEIDLKQAEEFGREMAERSRRIESGEKELIPELPKGNDYDAIYMGRGQSWQLKKEKQPLKQGDAELLELTGLRDFPFKFNREKCLYPKCTLCIDNCPTNSINMLVDPPIIRKRCDRCWYCEQICPSGAIEVDWESIVRVIDNNLYDNFSELSNEAEAKGFFRRLVPLEDVGRKSYWYTVKKQPRLKPLS
jgi:flavodoxin/ferredoxin